MIDLKSIFNSRTCLISEETLILLSFKASEQLFELLMPSKLSFLKTLSIKKETGGEDLSVTEEDYENDLFKKDEVDGSALSMMDDVDRHDFSTKEEAVLMDVHKA